MHYTYFYRYLVKSVLHGTVHSSRNKHHHVSSENGQFKRFTKYVQIITYESFQMEVLVVVCATSASRRGRSTVANHKQYRCMCNYGVRLRREVNSTLSYNDHRGLGRPRRMLETQINKTEFFDCEQREMQDVRLAETLIPIDRIEILHVPKICFPSHVTHLTTRREGRPS